uniref:Cytochrome c biogenesis protein n=1 Tax=Camptotheca acuminata TaxID=16922 RepID=A0A288WIZ6_CAMAC|nr:cytochrome c biogenesis protein [Camptotheca acuminata]ARX79287.1 cytochrome c biogenesis protein [Camptotheca acuminata]
MIFSTLEHILTHITYIKSYLLFDRFNCNYNSFNNFIS